MFRLRLVESEAACKVNQQADAKRPRSGPASCCAAAFDAYESNAGESRHRPVNSRCGQAGQQPAAMNAALAVPVAPSATARARAAVVIRPPAGGLELAHAGGSGLDGLRPWESPRRRQAATASPSCCGIRPRRAGARTGHAVAGRRIPDRGLHNLAVPTAGRNDVDPRYGVGPQSRRPWFRPRTVDAGRAGTHSSEPASLDRAPDAALAEVHPAVDRDRRIRPALRAAEARRAGDPAWSAARCKAAGQRHRGRR